mgnify:CR=1 FL=1
MGQLSLRVAGGGTNADSSSCACASYRLLRLNWRDTPLAISAVTISGTIIDGDSVISITTTSPVSGEREKPAKKPTMPRSAIACGCTSGSRRPMS